LLTEDNDGSREVQRRIARATGAMEQFEKIWRSKNISTDLTRYLSILF